MTQDASATFGTRAASAVFADRQKPEVLVTKWWQDLLHNQRAQLLKLPVSVREKQRITVINIPWSLWRSAGITTDNPSRQIAASFG